VAVSSKPLQPGQMLGAEVAVLHFLDVRVTLKAKNSLKQLWQVMVKKVLLDWPKILEIDDIKFTVRRQSYKTFTAVIYGFSQ
jgi:hypothetical protein